MVDRYGSTPNLSGPSRYRKVPVQVVESKLEVGSASNLELPKKGLKLAPPLTNHDVIDYYASEEDLSRDSADDDDTMISSTNGEPFTLINRQAPKQARQRVVSKPITHKESYTSLKKSRTSLVRVRTAIGQSMAVVEAEKTPRTTRNSVLNSDYDMYGFKKSNNFVSRQDYDAWWGSYSPYLIKRRKKWEKMMLKNGLHTTNRVSPTRFPPRSEDLRKFVRKGIPAEWRGNAWFYFAKGPEKLRDNKGVYDRLVDQTMDIINENTEAIEKDLHRTFPENVHFRDIIRTDADGNKVEEESPLLQTLRRVLKCFAVYNPSIGYCQSLNFIAGLLLIFMDEEKAFWMLVIITDRYLPGIHELDLEGVNVHQGVLMLCLRQYLPDVWQMIVERNDTHYATGRNDFLYDLPALSFCTTSWFMSMYIGVLPTETMLRVWDCLYYEDSKVLFQVALTIFKEMKPELEKVVERNAGEDNDMLASELFQVIQNYPKRILDANKLLTDCFKYSNFSKLSQEEIAKCKQYVIESRSRYQNLIKKRSAIGLREADRKQLMQSSDTLLENGKIGLKALNWNGRLNHRMRRIQQKMDTKMRLD